MSRRALVLLLCRCTVQFPDDARYACQNDADCGGGGWVCASGACCDASAGACTGGAGGGTGGGGTGGAAGGSVSCPGGQAFCGAACVDVISNRAHCGVCGNACPADWPCANRACVAAPTNNPYLDTVTPASTMLGGMVTLMLTGERFAAGALLRLTGGGIDGERALTVTDAQHGTLTVDTAAAVAGTVEVRVIDPGRLVSNTRTFALTGMVAATPTLVSASPASVPAAYTGPLTATGSAFDGTSKVRLSGGALAMPKDFTTIYVSAAQLFVPSFDLTGVAEGSYTLSVTWSSGTTNTIPFTVQGSIPTVTTLSPVRAPKGAMLTLTVDGTNFDSTSKVRLTSASSVTTTLATALVSATRLSGGPLDLGPFAPGNYAVTVQNNGAFDSNAVGFVVESNDPTLVSVAPGGARQDQTVTLTLSGNNFLPGATVGISSATLPEMMLAATLVDSRTLTVTGLALSSYPIGGYQLKVRNVGSNPSGAVSFTVTEGTPTLSMVMPSIVSVSAAQPTSATLTGTFLYATSAVHISGNGITDSVLPTTFLSSTQLRVTQDLTGVQTGTYSIWVTNPASPSPLSSNTMMVTVNP
jgi:hypothetical protein